ncbi:MAG: phosphate acyltransferase PlsX [Candidatus Omnitrophota bacterium]
MVKVAVDGMGGDHAPEVVVEGALLAVREYQDLEVVLVGRRDLLTRELSKAEPHPRIYIHHAAEVVEMAESAAKSVRKKRDASIIVAADLVRQKAAEAVVSAGHTGASVVATTLSWGLLEGIDKPGIAIAYPTLSGASVLIDIGANIDAKPEHLLQYAIMGSIFANVILRKEAPRVGLLNIGEEESKGPDFMKETHRLLGGSPLNFIGNVEGRELFLGNVDVIVCDGFVGNIVLKVTESLAENTNILLRRELRGGMLSRVGGLLIKSSLSRLKKRLDYAEFGGAPLLGVNGICMIGHGSSSAKAIKNAIRVAKEFVKNNVNEQIQTILHTKQGNNH